MILKSKKGDTVINNFLTEDGELLDQTIETKTHKIILEDKEDFWLMFASIEGLLDNIDKVATKVLVFCIKNAQFNTNKVSLSKPMLEDLEKSSGLKYQTIKNAIGRLKKAGALISLGSAVYRVNPRYFWKGDSVNRKKTMYYILEVECKECEEQLFGKPEETKKIMTPNPNVE